MRCCGVTHFLYEKSWFKKQFFEYKKYIASQQHTFCKKNSSFPVPLRAQGQTRTWRSWSPVNRFGHLKNYTVENIFNDEYPSKPGGHNWPRSFEQYKTQVGGLQKDMDDVFEIIEEYEEKIEELEKLVANLRVEVAKKKDK